MSLNMRMERELINLVEWVQDAGNPEEVSAPAHSTLQEYDIVGFRKIGECVRMNPTSPSPPSANLGSANRFHLPIFPTVTKLCEVPLDSLSLAYIESGGLRCYYWPPRLFPALIVAFIVVLWVLPSAIRGRRIRSSRQSGWTLVPEATEWSA